ncbi:MAG: PAS domain S-box protein [Chloroflexota bacterium]
MKLPRIRLDLRVAVLYALFGSVWILASDRLLASLVTDATALTRLQTYKGWAFVAASALVIYLLLRRELTLLKIAKGKLDESKERYRQLFEHSLDAILLTSPDGSIHAVNPSACRMFGRNEAEIIQGGRNGVVDVTDPRLQLALEERAHTGRFNGELTFIRNDGTKFDGEISSTIFKSRDGTEHTSMIIRDVTERKRVELALKESEEKYRLLVENATVGIVVAQDQRLKYVNPWAMQLVGYSMEELISTDFAQHIHPHDLEETIGFYLKFLQGEATPKSHTFRIIDSAGATKWLESNAVLVSQNGRPASMNFLVDITERKRAEEDLRESEEKFRTVADFTYDWEYWVDPNGQMIYVSPSCERISGRRAEEFLADANLLHQIMLPEDFPILQKHARDDFGGDEPAGIDFRIRKPDGEIRWINHICQPVRGTDGRWLGRRASNRDITERKQAEEALRLREERYKLISSVASDYMFYTRLDDRGELQLDWVAGAFESITGYTFEEYIAHGGWRVTVHPDDLAVDDRDMEKLRANQRVVTEIRTLTKSGAIRWVQVYAHPVVTLDNGNLVGIYGAVQDITERKRAEEERFRLMQVLESSLNEIYMFDEGTLRFTYVNQGARRNLGYSMDELRLLTPVDLKPEFTQETFREMIDPLTRHERDVLVFETVHRRKNGETYPVEVHLQLVETQGNRNFMAIIHDITERKQAEERLWESEERYRRLLEVSPVGIAVHSDGRLVFTNMAGARIIGANSPENVIGRSILEIIHPDNLDSARQRIQRMLAGEKGLYPVEDRYLRLDGTEVPVEVMAVPLTYEGKPAVQVIIQDITARKQAEQELRLSRDRLADLSRRLVEAHETERRAIGRELHDQFGQMLTAMKITLDLAAQLPPEIAAKKLEQAQELTSDLLNRVSRLSLELRPPMLDDLGLIPALVWHVNRYHEQTGIEVDFNHSDVEGRRFSPEIETTAYRIVQEALTNVARHARAARARLRVQAGGGWMEIQIEDDGVGFDPQIALAKNRGLSGMRERAQLVGGAFQIESENGKGTRKRVRLPLREEIS